MLCVHMSSLHCDKKIIFPLNHFSPTNTTYIPSPSLLAPNPFSHSYQNRFDLQVGRQNQVRPPKSDQLFLEIFVWLGHMVFVSRGTRRKKEDNAVGKGLYRKASRFKLRFENQIYKDDEILGANSQLSILCTAFLSLRHPYRCGVSRPILWKVPPPSLCALNPSTPTTWSLTA
jgi:hypothetical protein